MNKNLAIIGASYLQLPLIEKAKAMGYITHVFAWAADDVGEKAADFFYPISIVEKEQILFKCREINICGICSIASDLAMLTVNYVAEEMHLVGNSMDVTYRSTNKFLMREAFAKGNVPIPKYFLVNEENSMDALHLSYPVIVKPVDRSGSRGICKLDNSKGLKDAVQHALQEGFQKNVLIEEFAEGQEYSVECISYRGQHTFLAMTLKYTTGAPHFIETGHLEPAPVSVAILNEVKRVVFHALDTLGIQNGASHSELKIDESGNIKIIEIAGRMGGDAIGSHLVKYSTGYDFVKMVIDVAVGNKPDFTKVCVPMKVESRFIFTHDDLFDFERIRVEHPEKVLEVLDMNPCNIGKITDSSNRAGCYVVKV